MNILIVDDVAFIRIGIKTSLSKYRNIYMFDAGTYEEAVKILDEEKIDLIFLDLNLNTNAQTKLEHENGLDIVRYLMEKDTDMPNVAILSGTVNESKMREAYNLGITNIVSKPFSTESLMSIIDEVHDAMYQVPLPR